MLIRLGVWVWGLHDWEGFGDGRRGPDCAPVPIHSDSGRLGAWRSGPHTPLSTASHLRVSRTFPGLTMGGVRPELILG